MTLLDVVLLAAIVLWAGAWIERRHRSLLDRAAAYQRWERWAAEDLERSLGPRIRHMLVMDAMFAARGAA